MKNDVKYGLIGNKTIEVSDTNTNYATGGWIAGVDDTNGYIIVSDTTTTNMVGFGTGGGLGAPAYPDMPMFWQSTGKTDAGLVALANQIPGSPGNFVDANTALIWLDASPYVLIGYGNTPNGTQINGDYYLYAQYSPAQLPGWITFPNHQINTYDLNPNHVGQTDNQTNSTYRTQIYINMFDDYNVDHSYIFNQFVGHSGTLTLTQGVNSVTYSFTDQAFEVGNYGGNEVYADNAFENSVLGSITVLSPSNADFNTTEPITISYTIN